MSGHFYGGCDCISNDGKYLGVSEIVLKCPSCGRETKQPVVSTNSIPRDCTHPVKNDEGIAMYDAYQMEFIRQQPPAGFRFLTQDDIDKLTNKEEPQ